MYKNIPLLTLILSFLLQPVLFSQNLDKFYSSRVQEGGDIFFVFPNQDFKNTANHSAFIFDLTLRENHDTTHLNFTYSTLEPSPARQLRIKSGDYTIVSQTKKLYVDFVKHKWEHRYSASFSFDDLQKITSSATPCQFEVETKNATLVYVIRPKKWQKYTNALDKVFYIIFPERFE